MRNNWVILRHQLISPVDLRWTSRDVHATNHSEFDEIHSTLSWSISTTQCNAHNVIETCRDILESDQDRENVRRVTSMLRAHDLEYRMDLTARLHTDQERLNKQHIHHHLSSNFFLSFTLTSMSFDNVFGWCYFFPIDFCKITCFAHRTKLFLYEQKQVT